MATRVPLESRNRITHAEVVVNCPILIRLNRGAGNDTLTGQLGNDLLDGGAGINTLAQAGNVSFTLTDKKLTGVRTDTLANLQIATLTGGVGKNIFTVSGWTGSGILVGGDGTDCIVAARDTDSSLNNSSLISAERTAQRGSTTPRSKTTQPPTASPATKTATGCSNPTSTHCSTSPPP